MKKQNILGEYCCIKHEGSSSTPIEATVVDKVHFYLKCVILFLYFLLL
jgi:hypothetical protein